MPFQALDLFCGAGGATKGLQRAGFHVTGVDHRPQPRYCGDAFVQGDALKPPFDLSDFALIWASPPCQRYTIVWRGQESSRRQYPDLIEPTRRLLAAHAQTVIENVPGAPLRPDCVLTGAQFDLDIVRNRVFEICGFSVPFQLVRQHTKKVSDGGLASVYGSGYNNGWNSRRKLGPSAKWLDIPKELRESILRRNSAAGWREAMDIDWMTRDELREAVPPAYAEFIGCAAMQFLKEKAA